MVECVEISLKSFESKLLQNAISQILSILPPQWKSSIFSFPMTQKKFTILRSPHIDKKSREQFQIQYFKNIIRLNIQKHEILSKNTIHFMFQNQKNLKSFVELSFFQLFIENLKRLKFLGVHMKIRIIYTTFLGK